MPWSLKQSLVTTYKVNTKESHANNLSRVSLRFSYEIADTAHRRVQDKQQSDIELDPDLYNPRD